MNQISANMVRFDILWHCKSLKMQQWHIVMMQLHLWIITFMVLNGLMDLLLSAPPQNGDNSLWPSISPMKISSSNYDFVRIWAHCKCFLPLFGARLFHGSRITSMHADYFKCKNSLSRCKCTYQILIPFKSRCKHTVKKIRYSQQIGIGHQGL